MCRWKKTDESDFLAYCPNHIQMMLIYGRIYTSGAGYKHSDTNQLILNLKKSVNAPANQLPHKERAIQKFGDEASLFLRDFEKSQNLCLVPMPSSKTESHSEYDDRVEKVAKHVHNKLMTRSVYLQMLETITDRVPTHSGGLRNEVYGSMKINELAIKVYEPGSIIVIIDDVLTSGSHFSAAYRHITSRLPTAKIVGIFWAKAQDPDFNSSISQAVLSEDSIDF